MPAAKLTRAQVRDVRATAIATGSLADAARLHGITHDHARQLASRGKWPVGQRAQRLADDAAANAVTMTARASKSDVTRVTPTAADAIAASIADNRSASSALAHAENRRALEALSRRKPIAIKNMRDLGEAAKIAEPREASPTALIQFNIL